jgi:hypothetical protein
MTVLNYNTCIQASIRHISNSNRISIYLKLLLFGSVINSQEHVADHHFNKKCNKFQFKPVEPNLAIPPPPLPNSILKFMTPFCFPCVMQGKEFEERGGHLTSFFSPECTFQNSVLYYKIFINMTVTVSSQFFSLTIV